MRSTPGNSGSGNITPASTRIDASPHATSIMFMPNSRRPPRGTTSRAGPAGSGAGEGNVMDAAPCDATKPAPFARVLAAPPCDAARGRHPPASGCPVHVACRLAPRRCERRRPTARGTALHRAPAATGAWERPWEGTGPRDYSMDGRHRGPRHRPSTAPRDAPVRSGATTPRPTMARKRGFTRPRPGRRARTRRAAGRGGRRPGGWRWQAEGCGQPCVPGARGRARRTREHRLPAPPFRTLPSTPGARQPRELSISGSPGAGARRSRPPPALPRGRAAGGATRAGVGSVFRRWRKTDRTTRSKAATSPSGCSPGGTGT